MGAIIVKDGPAKGRVFNYHGNPRVVVLAEKKKGGVTYHDYGRKADGKYYHSQWCRCSSTDKDM